MREINYYLKKHMISTVIAMLLFIVQGLCVLALVVFGNNAIDVGLLKNGYESSAPEALIQSSFENRIAALSDDDRQFVQSHYTLLDKKNMTVDEYQIYEQNYPVIASQLIYKKNWIGVNDINEQLEQVFSISKDEMLYEYMSLGMNTIENKKNYIKEKIQMMAMAAIIFVIVFAGANMLVASIAAKIGYEERQKIVEGSGKGLRESLDLQDKTKAAARKFYALVLGVCGFIGAIYYYNDYRLLGVIDKDHIVICILSILIFAVSIYSAISVRGALNKGIFLVGKVIILGGVTAIFGSEIAVGIIFGYGLTLGVLLLIRRLVGKKLSTLISAHDENIENIDGQMAFVMNKDDVEIEPVQMKKMVRAYLTNNEYLYRSSWMLEFLENMDKAVVTLFNFFGVIVVIASFSYFYISMGVPIIMILPLLMIYNF